MEGGDTGRWDDAFSAVVSSFISPRCFGAKDKHLNGILYSKVESFSQLFSSYFSHSICLSYVNIFVAFGCPHFETRARVSLILGATCTQNVHFMSFGFVIRWQKKRQEKPTVYTWKVSHTIERKLREFCLTTHPGTSWFRKRIWGNSVGKDLLNPGKTHLVKPQTFHSKKLYLLGLRSSKKKRSN